MSADFVMTLLILPGALLVLMIIGVGVVRVARHSGNGDGE